MPIIFLVDTSGRMQGERIKAVNKGMQTILQCLRQDPYTLETAWLSVATFNMQFTPLSELTEIVEFEVPLIDSIPSTPAMLGNAISSLADWLTPRIKACESNQLGKDFRCKVILFWGGGIGDPQQLENATQKIRKLPMDILAIPISTSNTNKLPESWATITSENVEIDSCTVKTFFRWIDDDYSLHNSEPVSLYLPPLPKEIII